MAFVSSSSQLQPEKGTSRRIPIIIRGALRDAGPGQGSKTRKLSIGTEWMEGEKKEKSLPLWITHPVIESDNTTNQILKGFLSSKTTRGCICNIYIWFYSPAAPSRKDMFGRSYPLPSILLLTPQLLHRTSQLLHRTSASEISFAHVQAQHGSNCGRVINSVPTFP